MEVQRQVLFELGWELVPLGTETSEQGDQRLESLLFECELLWHIYTNIELIRQILCVGF